MHRIRASGKSPLPPLYHEFLPFMRHGIRLSTAFLLYHRGALTEES